MRILFVLTPSWHNEAILPYEVDFFEFCSQSLFAGDLGTPGVLRDREWHALDEVERHLVFRRLLEEVARR